MRKINNNAKFHITLNKLYTEFQEDNNWSDDTVIAFSNWLRARYGIAIKIHPKLDDLGRQGYELTEVSVIDEKKYTWFLLETSA